MDTGQGKPAKGPWSDDGQQHGNASRARDDGQGIPQGRMPSDYNDGQGPDPSHMSANVGNMSGGQEHAYNVPAAPKGKDVPPGTSI